MFAAWRLCRGCVASYGRLARSDGLPDAYENHWFGSTNVIDTSSSFGAGGFSIGFSLVAGIIPTNAADSAYLSTNRVAAWKLTDAFFAAGDAPISATAIYERTFRIARNGAWEQFFLSSKPDCAGAWQLEGVAFEWEDSEGGSGSATASPSGDSLYMPVSTNSPATLTIHLRQTADTMSCRTPLYLLAFSPDIEVEGTESIATDNGIWNVATIANETSFPISIDRSERPCKAPLYRQEEAALIQEVQTAQCLEGKTLNRLPLCEGCGHHLPFVGLVTVGSLPLQGVDVRANPRTIFGLSV